MVCEIFPDRGLNLCPLHWQVDCYLLDYQGSLPNSVFMGKKHQSFRPVILGIYSHIRVSLAEQNHRDLWEGTIQSRSHGFPDLVWSSFFCSPLQHRFLWVSPRTLYYLGKRSCFVFTEHVFVSSGPLNLYPHSSLCDLLPSPAAQWWLCYRLSEFWS